MGCVRPEFNSQHPDTACPPAGRCYTDSMLRQLLSRRREQANLFRNFIFGVEDSLVSTVGLLSGVATAAAPRQTIVTTGVILIFVEAFSMGVGSFLSEDNSTHSDHSRSTHRRITRAALVMFVSYFAAGFIPLSPYLLLPPTSAMPLSITLTLATLGALGLYSAAHNHTSLLRGLLEMFVLGGAATTIGIVVGTLLG